MYICTRTYIYELIVGLELDDLTRGGGGGELYRAGLIGGYTCSAAANFRARLFAPGTYTDIQRERDRDEESDVRSVRA